MTHKLRVITLYYLFLLYFIINEISFKMGNISIFLFAVIANCVLAVSSLIRDKIEVIHCQNPETLQPEMKIEAPAEIIPENMFDQYLLIGDKIEVTISEDNLSMVSHDECKFTIL